MRTTESDHFMQVKLDILHHQYGEEKIKTVQQRLDHLQIDVPSWGFNRGGTRFGSFSDGTEANTVHKRILAAKKVFETTRLGKHIAFHFPWDGDSLSDCALIKKWVKECNLKVGAINTNMFEMRPSKGLDHHLKLGSFTNPFPEIQERMVTHNLESLEYMRFLESNTLSLWFPDGTNSAGQLSLYDQANQMEKNLALVYKELGTHERIFIEYKLFEPSFYSTAIPDWGRALKLCEKLGSNAKVLVGLGHHPLGTNIEQIVAFLIREKRLGGFHFNDKKYADDDLATASIDPFQLFRIFEIIIEGEELGYIQPNSINFCLDQSHTLKDPIEEVIESLENIKRLYAKALLVDREHLQNARLKGNISLADKLLTQAFWEDVSPLIDPK